MIFLCLTKFKITDILNGKSCDGKKYGVSFGKEIRRLV